ncbi:MAG: GNAT family N-acetyltransferase [Pseudomonadota bacterium]
MAHLLENIFWHALTGPHARYAAGAGDARRYAQGFSPILAFADAERPDFAALLPFCELGEHFYCGGWSGAAPAGWHIDAETTMFRMVWDGDMPELDDTFTCVKLASQDADQAVALASLTNPGPFGLRTIELGEYLACFEADRLIAMAGERSFAGVYREVSGVCTHPDFQGKGMARRLMNLLIRRQLQAGETPFLHVMSSNTNAHQLYLRMGFRDYCETPVRVMSRA